MLVKFVSIFGNSRVVIFITFISIFHNLANFANYMIVVTWSWNDGYNPNITAFAQGSVTGIYAVLSQRVAMVFNGCPVEPSKNGPR